MTGAIETPRGAAPRPVQTLVERFDHDAFDLPTTRATIRLAVPGKGAWDAVVEERQLRLEPARDGQPDALLEAGVETWRSIAADVAGGMEAFRRRRLVVRHNLHLGVGFLAATSGDTGPERLRFRRVPSRAGDFSVIEAGAGAPVLMLHGLGGTKASFLPTIRALAPGFRTIAVDLLGFGDSDKPIGASYGPDFQARGVVAVLDALRLDRAHLIGHSMGGRVALEVGFTYPERSMGLVLMTPAMAWLRSRRWAPFLRLLRPELGLLQATPRPLVEGLLRRTLPGADTAWGVPAIDEFVRMYATARGRAAFYAAARHIYLDEPHGDRGFWTRLRELAPESLFIWGTHDPLVPIGFAKHVEQALPAARHVEVDCGHIPQMQSPGPTHEAISSFLSDLRVSGVAMPGRRRHRRAPGAAERAPY